MNDIPNFIFATVPISTPGEWPDIVVGVFTAGIFFVAWWQLGAIKKTAYADFAHRLNADFFTDKCDELKRHILSGTITFQVVGEKAIFTDGENTLFDDTDLDRHVLGPLEAVGIFEKRHILDLEFVYDMFGSAIIEILDNAEIVKYVRWVRQQKNSRDVYDCVLFLHKECLVLTRAKECGSLPFLKWKITSALHSQFLRR